MNGVQVYLCMRDALEDPDGLLVERSKLHNEEEKIRPTERRCFVALGTYRYFFLDTTPQAASD